MNKELQRYMVMPLHIFLTSYQQHNDQPNFGYFTILSMLDVRKNFSQ